MEHMERVGDASENDVAMEVPQGYRVVCVVCGEPARTEGDDAGKLAVQSFSYGFSEDTAFCTGLAFLCDEHEHYAGTHFALMVRLGSIAKANGAA